MVRAPGAYVSQHIRVAIANRPRLMRDLVASTMADQPDIEVVAEIEDESAIPSVVEETAPEFLIIALDSPDKRPSLCDSLLRQYPAMKILALAPEGNWSVIYWASIDIHAISFEASEIGILNTLRSNSQISGRQP
jgi:DNA-binding NarL/FixJ family response regulator